MGTSPWHLQQKKERLKREISENLDFLVGSVTTQGPTGGFILTTKENAKTKSRYIRVGILQEVQTMTLRHRKLKALLKELGALNWELLKMESSS
ncbi:MAG: hypothetical protein GKR87_14870 [Kiritimatiellae bacterium]|nr:hypothetical protein [Kiritimatiellia bacterium]